MKDNVSTVATDLEGFGTIVVGTSRVQLAINNVTIEVRIRAHPDNTGTIYVGKSNVLSDGSNDYVSLEAGEEQIIRYNVVDNPIFVISDMAAQNIKLGVLR